MRWTHEDAAMAADLADQIALHLTSDEVEECKKAALELALDTDPS